MSYTPGTKLSYKTGRPDRVGDSSVVVIRDGSLLEVRKGNNTFKGAKNADRFSWATLEEWKATLPPGATFAVSGQVRAASASVSSNPDIARIQEKFRAAKMRAPHTYSNAFRTLWRPLTHIDLISLYEGYIAQIQEKINSTTALDNHRNSKQTIDMYQSRIEQFRRKPMTEVKFSVMKLNGATNPLILYGQREDHSLQGIYISGKHGKFAIKHEDDSLQLVNRLEELGFAEILVRVGDTMVPL